MIARVWSAQTTSAQTPAYVAHFNSQVLPDVRQVVARPVLRPDPYATPAPGLFLCSASTPPGAGVHGLCGAFAARSALRRVFGVRPAERS